MTFMGFWGTGVEPGTQYTEKVSCTVWKMMNMQFALDSVTTRQAVNCTRARKRVHTYFTNIKESKSNKNADSYLPHGNTILVAPPGGQSVMDINAD